MAGVAGAGTLLLRLFPPWSYSIYPACLWRALTGWRCPGCGSTHALAALLAGQWSVAVHYNAPAAILAPVAAILFAVQVYSAMRYNGWVVFDASPHGELRLRIRR